MKREERREWRELKSRIFRPAESKWGEDVFVSRVLARIAEKPTQGFVGRLGLWFKVPALVFAAVLLFMVTPLPDEISPSLETLLLSERSNEPICRLYSGAQVSSDEVFGISTEEL